jgi:DNA polymerase-1
VHIVSGDKDFAQLVGDHVRHRWITMRDVTYDAELVRKKWGVPPAQMRGPTRRWWATSVDNVPGVPGIGQKTAAQLLADHGSLDGVLAHLDQLKGKVKATLTEHQDLAKLSRSLATIDRQVPLAATLEDLRLPEADVAGLDTLYRELEFWSLLSGPARPTRRPTPAPCSCSRRPRPCARTWRRWATR